MTDRDITRRRLLVVAGASAFGAASLSQAVRALDAVAQELLPPGARPALSPEDPAVRATMAAFADTIVPGPAGGGARDPGAVEAGAVDEIYHPFYGVSGVFPLLHDDLVLATSRMLGRPAAFTLELSYRDRERIVEDRMTQPSAGGQNPYATAYGAAAVLVYLAFYGETQSDLGLKVMKFPGQSDGYFPRHSHRTRFKTMTSHGNPR